MIPGPRISAESGMQGQDTEANARDDASNLPQDDEEQIPDRRCAVRNDGKIRS